METVSFHIFLHHKICDVEYVNVDVDFSYSLSLFS